MKEVPQVLLLGNGINISNGSKNWDEFLESIKDENFNIPIEQLKSPMPLRAILVSNNRLNEKLKEKKTELLPTNKLLNNKIPLSEVLSIGFDEILTTNYTYELEQACFDGEPISEYGLKRLSVNALGGSPERKYLITTYNKAIFNGTSQRIWHIHGEARKHSSMVLGHDYYGRLTKQIIEYIEKKKNAYSWYQRHNQSMEITSWIDAFIMGDVYILGQGFHFSEIDLWWLLNRKNNEKAEHGNVYFYENNTGREKEKIKLLEILGVKVANVVGQRNGIDYADFYKRALNEIKETVKKNKKRRDENG